MAAFYPHNHSAGETFYINNSQTTTASSNIWVERLMVQQSGGLAQRSPVPQELSARAWLDRELARVRLKARL